MESLDAADLPGGALVLVADAIQVASALAIDADAPVTHDRDFSNLRGLRIPV